MAIARLRRARVLVVLAGALVPGAALAQSDSAPVPAVVSDIRAPGEPKGPDELLVNLLQHARDQGLTNAGRTLHHPSWLDDVLPDYPDSALFHVLVVADRLSSYLDEDGVPYRQHRWARGSDQENLRVGIDCSRAVWFAFTRARVPYTQDDIYLPTAKMLKRDSAMAEHFMPCRPDRLRLGDVLVYRGTNLQGQAVGHTVMVVDPDAHIAWGSHGWDGSELQDTGVELQEVLGGRGWRAWDSRRMRLRACWRHRAFRRYRLTVSATPPDASVEVENVRYRPGARLDGGWYRVRVSRKGCRPEERSFWHSEDRVLPIDLACAPQPLSVMQDRLASGSLGPWMVVLPPGRFDMGGPEADAQPRRSVEISRRFAMGQFEVTVAQYRRYCRAASVPCPAAHRRTPVVNVSWEAAQGYTRWLSRETGHTYRLPTEAEWEYAARAGTQGAFWWGRRSPRGRAVCMDCGTRPPRGPRHVGTTRPNRFKLYDMAGNVSEWVEDVYRADAYGRLGRRDPVLGGDGAVRVRRGGGWRAPRARLGSGTRGRSAAREGRGDVGFRVVREL